MVDSSCVFCGSCVQVCPTAALVPKARQGRGREADFDSMRTICSYCGVGCSLEFQRKDEQIVYARGYPAAPVNGEFLCVKGRSGWDFVSSPDRLTQPMVRKDLAHKLGLTAHAWHLSATSPLKARSVDHFVPVSWEFALDLVAERLAQVIQGHGPDAVAGLTSARCTNEENYLFQKLMRAGMGTNNVDHCARLCHASTVTGLGMAFGSGAMTNSIQEIRDTDCILITGSNTAESHPVISYEVVRAVKSGASLVIIDPRRVPMVEHATLWLQPTPGTDVYVFLAMAHVILREGWEDQAFIAARTENFAAFAASVEPYTPELAALHSGVPVEKIELAARLYALGQRHNTQTPTRNTQHALVPPWPLLHPLRHGHHPAHQRDGSGALPGEPGHGGRAVGQAVHGRESVARPGQRPGRVRRGRAAQRAAGLPAGDRCGQAGRRGQGLGRGRTAGRERAYRDGDDARGAGWPPRAMFIMGENPMLSDPDLTHVEEALRALDFLVVQDIFLSESAQLAHVVLPAAAALEKDGTVTNTERRVQLIRPVVAAPGAALPDWQILARWRKSWTRSWAGSRASSAGALPTRRRSWPNWPR